jgi:hypothetical protein
VELGVRWDIAAASLVQRKGYVFPVAVVAFIVPVIFPSLDQRAVF